MPPLLFARLQADVDELKIRRGAWYRVLEVGTLQAVLEVNRKPVAVLKAMLEIKSRPPLRWTVVPRPASAKRAPPELAGPVYGVCPSCRTRAPLPKRARELRCPRCKQEFDVDWGEAYLK
jgi:Zn finger protein HypA/HybF involved in hydrogenase expression